MLAKCEPSLLFMQAYAESSATHLLLALGWGVRELHVCQKGMNVRSTSFKKYKVLGWSNNC